MDATKLGANTAQPADLVFLDPPYGKGLGARALTAALTANWIAPEALIAWEENAPQTAPDGFDLVDTRRFGDTTLTLITAR